MLRREKLANKRKVIFFLDALRIILHHVTYLATHKSPTHTFSKIFFFTHPISFLNLTSLILFVNKVHHLYHHPRLFPPIQPFIHSYRHHSMSCCRTKRAVTEERTTKSTRWKLTGLLSSMCLQLFFLFFFLEDFCSGDEYMKTHGWEL